MKTHSEIALRLNSKLKDNSEILSAYLERCGMEASCQIWDVFERMFERLVDWLDKQLPALTQEQYDLLSEQASKWAKEKEGEIQRYFTL